MTTAFPSITATVAALLGLLAVFLTFRVIALRVRFRVNAGDGGQAALAQAIRAHANLIELAPLALLLLAFVEWSIAWRGVILVLGIALLVGRLASAWGLSHSLETGTARKLGASLTSLVVVACSVLILYRMLVVS
jgi:uncharacterized membrane protein YecN with MAPEG domain